MYNSMRTYIAESFDDKPLLNGVRIIAPEATPVITVK